MSAITLRAYLESLLLERDVSKSHAESLRFRIDLYGQHLGRIATLDDLEPDSLNRWVVSLQETGRYRPRTVKHYRDAVLFVWRAAFDRADATTPPWRIRYVKVPHVPIRAWSLDEARLLVNSVGILRGSVPDTSLRKRDWMRSYISVAYCTGLRRCDITNHARWCDLSGDILTVCQNKTGYVVSRRLSVQALSALGLLWHESPGDYLLPWPGDVRRFYESFRRCVIAAGIRPGTPKYLRRLSGSLVERDNPGMGGQFLGHRDPAVFDRSYHDRSISLSVPQGPPEL